MPNALRPAMSFLKRLILVSAVLGLPSQLAYSQTDNTRTDNTQTGNAQLDDGAQVDAQIIGAQDAADEAPKQRPNIIGDIVTLRTLDKVTAITKDYDVKIGESLKFASLNIDVKHCEVKPPEAIPETFAFLQIFEPPQLRTKEREKLTEEPEPIKLFSGWMLASKPAISALDHPVYDVWVIGCKGGAIQG